MTELFNDDSLGVRLDCTDFESKEVFADCGIFLKNESILEGVLIELSTF
jgi:hypothetical protein